LLHYALVGMSELDTEENIAKSPNELVVFQY
jgi:hypothetical protein